MDASLHQKIALGKALQFNGVWLAACGATGTVERDVSRIFSVVWSNWA